jgi:1-deoxy-D-xylulose-5-phosphate reductoisomerase
MPAALNAANEQAAALFLEEGILFLDIPRLIEKVCDRRRADLSADPSLADVLAVDGWARQAVLVATGQGLDTAPPPKPPCRHEAFHRQI